MEKKNKPIIVCGTGRCGSSVIAGALFYLGVHMGDIIPLPDKKQPAGYFEDMELGTLVYETMNGFMPIEEFREKAKKMFDERSEKYEHWGWKNPITQPMLDEILKLTGGAKFIWVRRKAWPTMKSMRRHWLYGWLAAYKRYKRDDGFLREGLKDEEVLEIWYCDIMDRAEIVESIINFTGIKPTEKQQRRAVQSILLPPAPQIRRTEASLWTFRD